MKYVEIELFGHAWDVEVIFHSNDIGDFDIQTVHLVDESASLQIDLTEMVDSVSSLQDQFDGAIIAKLKEEQDNV